MNNQEAFNLVLSAMREQGMPAFEHTDGGQGVCMYRTKGENFKCAVGALLRDVECVGLLNIGVNALAEEGWLPERLKGVNIKMLSAMQWAHDDEALDHEAPLSTWFERFEKRMAAIAQRFNLEMP